MRYLKQLAFVAFTVSVGSSIEAQQLLSVFGGGGGAAGRLPDDVAITPDGTQAVARWAGGNGTGEITIYDMGSGTQTASLVLPAAPDGRDGVEVTNDAAICIGGSFFPMSTVGNAVIWDLSTSPPVVMLNDALVTPLYDVAISPDGTTAVAVGTGTIRIYDLVAGALVAALPFTDPVTGMIADPFLSPMVGDCVEISNTAALVVGTTAAGGPAGVGVNTIVDFSGVPVVLNSLRAAFPHDVAVSPNGLIGVVRDSVQTTTYDMTTGAATAVIPGLPPQGQDSVVMSNAFAVVTGGGASGVGPGEVDVIDLGLATPSSIFAGGPIALSTTPHDLELTPNESLVVIRRPGAITQLGLTPASIPIDAPSAPGTPFLGVGSLGNASDSISVSDTHAVAVGGGDAYVWDISPGSGFPMQTITGSDRSVDVEISPDSMTAMFKTVDTAGPSTNADETMFVDLRYPVGSLPVARFTQNSQDFCNDYVKLHDSRAVSLDGQVNVFGGTGQLFFSGELRIYDTVFPAIEPGQTFCTGDGGDQMGCTNCPCGNNAALGSGGGCLNSLAVTAGANSGAILQDAGFASVANDTMSFTATGLPPNTLSVLNVAVTALPTNPINPCFGTEAGVMSLAFDGLRCIGMGPMGEPVVRIGSSSADANGNVNPAGPIFGPGLIASQGWIPGQTRFFHMIYRDSNMQVCGTGLNTTQGERVLITP